MFAIADAVTNSFNKRAWNSFVNQKTFSIVPLMGVDVPVESVKFPFVNSTALAIELTGLPTIISVYNATTYVMLRMITKITILADAFNAIPSAKVGSSLIAHAALHNAVIDVILRVELPCHCHVETTEDLGQIEQRTKSLE